MSTPVTIVDMTPLKKVTVYRWVCQRKQCRHEWDAKDITKEPKRCARCKRLDWNRPTMNIGRPPKSGPKLKKIKTSKEKRGPKPQKRRR